MRIAQENDLVLLIAPRGKRYIVQLKAGAVLQTHVGVVRHDDLIGQPLGRYTTSHVGRSFLVLEPSTHDLIVNIRRHGQIIYPKESGFILLKMNIFSGRRVIEAGSGSGGLTLALARAVAPAGRVYSYDNRPDMQHLAIRNIQQAGLSDWVEFKERDIRDGFDEQDVDALFLDVRTPADYLEQARQALRLGGFLGCLVPTTNQVVALLDGLNAWSFAEIEVVELLLREYKPVSERLRPADTMVGHTGYLVFARKVAPPAASTPGSPAEAIAS